MNLRFENIRSFPSATLEVYDSLNRVPLCIQFEFDFGLGNYGRNFTDNDFIEFKFLVDEKKMSRITLISFNEKSVTSVNEIQINNCDGLPYSCLLNSEEERPQISLPISYYRSSDVVQAIWYPVDQFTGSFMVTKQLVVHVIENNVLAGITVIGLSEESIKAIFGFKLCVAVILLLWNIYGPIL